jgi:ATP-dependent Clp protease ATP-binding subunit ClpB
MEKNAVSRLVGAPPGYVGYEDGGQLSEAVRRHPYSVVLLDEVEKAHPDVFNLLLQVLDDGRITDSQGHRVDFRNTVVIMTSNLGSDHILELAGDDSRYEEMRKLVLKALQKQFRPEFLNRVDDLILFHCLSKTELRQIVALQVRRVERRLADQKLNLAISDAAIDFIADRGYDPVYGARPLKRAIQRLLENPIATKILETPFAPGSTIAVDRGDEELVLTTTQSTSPLPTVESPAVAAVTVQSHA